MTAIAHIPTFRTWHVTITIAPQRIHAVRVIARTATEAYRKARAGIFGDQTIRVINWHAE